MILLSLITLVIGYFLGHFFPIKSLLVKALGQQKGQAMLDLLTQSISK